MVGFLNGYAECPEKTEYMEAVRKIWDYINRYVIDKRENSEWFWALDESFDKLDMDSGENQAFGNPERDYVHFCQDVAHAVAELAGQFPEEGARYAAAFAGIADDPELAERIYLTNPLSFIGTDEQSRQAEHYRIRVGASDADTSLSVSMTLALKLANAGCGTVDYAMVWDQPHSEADYPGEVCRWIDAVCDLHSKSSAEPR